MPDARGRGNDLPRVVGSVVDLLDDGVGALHFGVDFIDAVGFSTNVSVVLEVCCQ
jgi:hypothetical protein